MNGGGSLYTTFYALVCVLCLLKAKLLNESVWIFKHSYVERVNAIATSEADQMTLQATSLKKALPYITDSSAIQKKIYI